MRRKYYSPEVGARRGGAPGVVARVRARGRTDAGVSSPMALRNRYAAGGVRRWLAITGRHPWHGRPSARGSAWRRAPWHDGGRVAAKQRIGRTGTASGMGDGIL